MFKSKKEIIAISKSETITEEQKQTAVEQFKTIDKEIVFISSFAEKNLSTLTYGLEDLIFDS